MAGIECQHVGCVRGRGHKARVVRTQRVRGRGARINAVNRVRWRLQIADHVVERRFSSINTTMCFRAGIGMAFISNERRAGTCECRSSWPRHRLSRRGRIILRCFARPPSEDRRCTPSSRSHSGEQYWGVEERRRFLAETVRNQELAPGAIRLPAFLAVEAQRELLEQCRC